MKNIVYHNGPGGQYSGSSTINTSVLDWCFFILLVLALSTRIDFNGSINRGEITMRVGQAGGQSHTDAERMRITSEFARAKDQAEADAAIESLQRHIESTARHERNAIDGSIELAANLGVNWTHHRYEEHISASQNSRETVAFIEAIADATSAMVVESLQADGFEVSTRTDERPDDSYKSYVDVFPEYYDTHFSIKW